MSIYENILEVFEYSSLCKSLQRFRGEHSCIIKYQKYEDVTFECASTSIIGCLDSLEIEEWVYFHKQTVHPNEDANRGYQAVTEWIAAQKFFCFRQCEDKTDDEFRNSQ